jgi:hypothetical protein
LLIRFCLSTISWGWVVIEFVSTSVLIYSMTWHKLVVVGASDPVDIITELVVWDPVAAVPVSVLDPVPVVPGDVVDGAVKRKGEISRDCGN